MAIGAYVGVNNTPRKITDIYVGVNNQPKRVKEAFIGVNNQPKRFWPPNATAGTWGANYYKLSDDTKLLWTNAFNRYYWKVNGGLAYCGLFQWVNPSYYQSPVFVSRDKDAVTYTTSWGGTFTSQGWFYYNDIKWYWSGHAYAVYTSQGDTYRPTDAMSPNLYSTANNLPQQPAVDLIALACARGDV